MKRVLPASLSERLHSASLVAQTDEGGLAAHLLTDEATPRRAQLAAAMGRLWQSSLMR